MGADEDSRKREAEADCLVTLAQSAKRARDKARKLWRCFLESAIQAPEFDPTWFLSAPAKRHNDQIARDPDLKLRNKSNPS